MPPKKKSNTSKPPTRGPRAKLAKENELLPEDELQIYEAWNLYSEEDVAGFEAEKEKVCPTSKVSFIFKILNIEPRSKKESDEFLEILDPESEGYVTYAHFVELAAIQINSKSAETKDAEVEKNYKLFTMGQQRPITYSDLRRVAGLLNQDVSDDVLKAMIIEANGGNMVADGVDMDQFRKIMSRAGVFR